MNRTSKSVILVFIISGLFNLGMGIAFCFWQYKYMNFDYSWNIVIGIIFGFILLTIGMKLHADTLPDKPKELSTKC